MKKRILSCFMALAPVPDAAASHGAGGGCAHAPYLRENLFAYYNAAPGQHL